MILVINVMAPVGIEPTLVIERVQVSPVELTDDVLAACSPDWCQCDKCDDLQVQPAVGPNPLGETMQTTKSSAYLNEIITEWQR